MGLLRFWLALAVVAAHSGGTLGVGGRAAVTMFYIISGYLMALVLNDIYQNRTLAFYTNRVLRIFVPAAAVGVLMLLAFALFSVPLPFASARGWFGVLSVVTSVTIVGQDLTWLFAAGHDNNLVWQPVDQPGPATPLFTYQYNRPLFTVAIELYFYAMAPFILRRYERVVAFTIIGFLWHLMAKVFGFYSLALNYHFWPASWFYFGSGALCYWMYKEQKQNNSGGWAALLPATPRARASMWLLVLFGLGLIGVRAYGWPFGYIVCVLTLPLLLAWSSRHPFDAYIGKYSYLLYLVHWPVLTILHTTSPAIQPGWTQFFAVTSISLVIAAVIHHGLEIPLDKLRERVRAAPIPNS